jgi:heme/copper-type cytochrome/quinol oxidase subunit 4
MLAKALILDNLVGPDGGDAPEFLKEIAYCAVLPLLVLTAGTSMAPSRRFLVAVILSALYLAWLAFVTLAATTILAKSSVWWSAVCALVSVAVIILFCIHVKKNENEILTEHPAEIPIGIFLLAGCFLALAAFGALFRAHSLLFAFVWLTIPVFACALNHRSALAWFTDAGLRGVQAALMTASVLLSFCIFFTIDNVRNPIGERFVEGYTHWRAAPRTDDDGREYYPGDEWTAENWAGRWSLHILEWTVYGLAFGVPAITLKATRNAIQKREIEAASVTSQPDRQEDKDVMYLDFKLPPSLKSGHRAEADDFQKLAASVIVSGFRRLASLNNCGPTSNTSDEKIIEIYGKVTEAFNEAAKKRGERIRAVYLNGIVMKFLQMYEWRFKKDDKPPLDERTADTFFRDHLQYEVDKYLAEGLRPDYRREVPLL